ncbi:MAG: hypothetical protein KJ066_14485 [Acidobacteria bacterium]|nr:hypothetical protein [Acidobacteriota bacterium]
MLDQDPDGNVTLRVSNQSFAVNPVDIAIAIDGEPLVRAELDVAGEQPAQHNWQTFRYRLPEGRHSLVASSTRGRARLETNFEVKDEVVVAIAHWDRAQGRGDGFFTCHVSSGAAGQM